MNFSTLFRLEENLHLDKKTLVTLRWIAIIGQIIAINLVYNYLNLKFPIVESHIIIMGHGRSDYLGYQERFSPALRAGDKHPDFLPAARGMGNPGAQAQAQKTDPEK